jgi:hypothetical protein
MKIIVHWGFDPYIDEIVEAPTHSSATEVPEDLVRQWNTASAELASLDKEIRELIREKRAAV